MRKYQNVADDYCEHTARMCYSLKPGFHASAAGEIKTINPSFTKPDTAEQTIFNKYIENTSFIECLIQTSDGVKYFLISAYEDNNRPDLFVFSNDQMTIDPPFYLKGKLYSEEIINHVHYALSG